MAIANNSPRMIATNKETGKVAWETPDAGLLTHPAAQRSATWRQEFQRELLVW
jgi:hypothetical protein